ncbi:YjjG family noncanonical pyrimidine nucleotidase [Vallitalea sp.]|jgi:YjjG family noncanonical pyrimidine nucleotidase|uniref:YjjG family noncanonical pyrimidine nucleotidase n=1 Tax=Vallitalea sp. TaxID=1882829 RepID=UPI0025F05D66|nr:YjjG family noncanonical pyrimidine nucleotidase [Vallitalea sp.]MCT4687462.1 YjjG family noncanonical pyrimidine nucleotidase [Vallitalea sp.]
MYKLVILDADGTLFNYEKAEKYALSESFKLFSFEGDILDISNYYKEINLNLWLELEKGNITKEELRYERFSRVFKQYKLDYDVNKFSDQYLIKLGESNFLIDEAEEICKYLKNKGYKIIVLTNGIKKVQVSRLEKSNIKKYIDKMIVSEEVGVNKPDPVIFDYTFNLIGHNDKNNAIMIGDSLTADIQGGINHGIDTCWVNLNNIKNTTNIIPKYEIHTLGELTTIL